MIWQHYFGNIKFIILDGKTKKTRGDVKYSDAKSRFNEETNIKMNMIIDYNKSMDGVYKLDQFRSYYDGKKLGW